MEGDGSKDDPTTLLSEIGLNETEQKLLFENDSATLDKNELHPLAAVGLGSFFVANMALLLSLPPVLRGKGM